MVRYTDGSAHKSAHPAISRAIHKCLVLQKLLGCKFYLSVSQVIVKTQRTSTPLPPPWWAIINAEGDYSNNTCSDNKYGFRWSVGGSYNKVYNNVIQRSKQCKSRIAFFFSANQSRTVNEKYHVLIVCFYLYRSVHRPSNPTRIISKCWCTDYSFVTVKIGITEWLPRSFFTVYFYLPRQCVCTFGSVFHWFVRSRKALFHVQTSAVKVHVETSAVKVLTFSTSLLFVSTYCINIKAHAPAEVRVTKAKSWCTGLSFKNIKHFLCCIFFLRRHLLLWGQWQTDRRREQRQAFLQYHQRQRDRWSSRGAQDGWHCGQWVH